MAYFKKADFSQLPPLFFPDMGVTVITEQDSREIIAADLSLNNPTLSSENAEWLAEIYVDLNAHQEKRKKGFWSPAHAQALRLGGVSVHVIQVDLAGLENFLSYLLRK